MPIRPIGPIRPINPTNPQKIPIFAKIFHYVPLAR